MHEPVAGATGERTITPERKITEIELRESFNWTKQKRDAVVEQTGEYLDRFLLMHGLKGSPVSKMTPAQQNQENPSVTQIWDNVIGCFRGTTHQLVKEGAILQESKLPAHSEYHVAKMVQLALRMYERSGAITKTNENALAIALASILHDTGSLLSEGENGPQERLYANHEIRAVGLVDQVIESLPINTALIAALKQKVKILVAVTNVDWDMDFSDNPTFNNTAIVKVINTYFGKGEPPSPELIDQICKDFKITNDTTDPNYRHAKLLAHTIVTCKGDDNTKKEYIELAKIMGAADHGSYLLEPAKVPETICLWKELQHYWPEGNGIMHRTTQQKNYLEYLTKDFPERQWGVYGALLSGLEYSPFWPKETPLSRRELVLHTYDSISAGLVQRDMVCRFEGFFAPTQLEELAIKLDVVSNPAVQKAIIDFSTLFSGDFHNITDFSALSTGVLQKMYHIMIQQHRGVEFFRAAADVITEQELKELLPNGTFRQFIAPYAYVSTDPQVSYDEVIADIQGAFDNAIPQTELLGLTFRQDKEDDIQKFIQTARDNAHKKPPVGIEIGGATEMVNSQLFDAVLQNTVSPPIQLLFHTGLEVNPRGGQTTALLTYLVAHTQTLTEGEKRDGFIDRVAVHIDGHIGEFLSCYRNMGEEEKKIIKRMIKSLSPIGHLLATDSREAHKNFQEIKELYGLFSNKDEVTINSDGQNNAVLGGLDVVAQHFVGKMMQQLNASRQK
ncbi:MAG: hypothetical protein V1922_00360 [bacterium]